MKDYSLVDKILNIDYYNNIYTSVDFKEDKTGSEACAYRDDYILINYVFSEYPEPYLKVYDISTPIYTIYRISLLKAQYLENNRLSKFQKELFIKALDSSPQTINGTISLFSKEEQKKINSIWDLIIYGMNRERKLFDREPIENLNKPDYSKLETID